MKTIISYNESGSYICPIDENDNDIDILDFFNENDFISLDGETVCYTEIDCYTVYLDADMNTNYKKELFEKILNGEFEISKEPTDVFIQSFDGITGYGNKIFYIVDLDEYKL